MTDDNKPEAFGPQDNQYARNHLFFEDMDSLQPLLLNDSNFDGD